MSLKKKSFVLYENYENTFRLLSLEQRGALITAIFEYERQQKVDIPLTKSTKVAFQNIKDTLDRDRESYLKKCEQRSACGKSGGRPSKTALTEENPKSKSFFSNPDNENDIDIDIENDIDSDIDSESENEKGNGMGNFPPAAPSAALRQEPPFPYAPRLTKEEVEKLVLEGVDRDYVAEREERAIVYAKKNKTSPSNLLLQWWKEDQIPWLKRKTSPAVGSGRPPSYGSIDDFFAVAYARAQEESAAFDK